MATVMRRKSKVYTISLPAEMARRAEAMAERDCRSMSELFREAFRSYAAQQARRTMEEIGAYAEGRNPKGYSARDVPRLIEEVRSEKPRRRQARTSV